ncbi:helicase [Schizophyllum commune]|nr:hypothetical protein K523DRAFT_358484 [Schizophyllum commune Tattone D]
MALKERYGKDQSALAVTATTGVAAANIGGSTLHSWGSLLIEKCNIDQQLEHIRKGPGLGRWLSVRTIIIDEVSMLGGDLFDFLHDIAKALRPTTDRPFGGIQVLACGDFFQVRSPSA